MSTGQPINELMKLAREDRRRRELALALYRPTPKQEAFHEAGCSERIVRGGHRCLAGSQLIYDPVRQESLRVDQIDADFHVLSVDPETGEMVVCEASRPFIKANGELVEVTLSNGAVLKVTRQHRVVSESGEWVSIEHAFRNQIPVAVVSGLQSRDSTARLSVEKRSRRTSQRQRRLTSKPGLLPALRLPATSALQFAHRVVSECLAASSRCRQRLQSMSAWLRSRPHCGLRTGIAVPLLSCQAIVSLLLWPAVSGAHVGTSWGIFPSVSLQGDRCSSQTVPDSQDGCHLSCRSCGGRLHRQSGSDRDTVPSQVCVHERIRHGWLWDDLGLLRERSQICPWCDHLATGSAGRLSGILSGEAGFQTFCTPYSLLSCRSQARSRLDEQTFPARRTSHGEVLSSEFLASHPACFSLQNSESVTITSVTTLENGRIWDIEVKGTNCYLIDGVINANSGKSTAGALEVAHAATRIPILKSDGTEVAYKYPTRPLKIWVIGKDEKHLGETIYTLLFKGGLFYVIDDVETGKPRIWNPNLPEDIARKKQRRTSGPMIPATEIEGNLSFSDRSINAVSRCTLKNGTEISFYPSGGNCPSGVPVDLLWIDEDIVYPEYVADWQGRLIDRGGRLIWTAFPWAQNDALMNLSQRAIEAEETGIENPDIREFRLSMSENPYLDPEETRKARDRWAAQGDIVLAARDRGEFPMDAVLMYPEFNRNIHGIDESRCPESTAAEILQRNGGEPPDDWMRLLALDPGSRKAAVLFATIPPPEVGDEMIIYDEIFQFNSDARQLAREVRLRTHGKVFHKFIIDGHAARITPTGLGRNIRSVYLDAFRELDIHSESGTSFIDGNDNVRWRTEQVRQWLRPIDRPAPRLMFWLPNMRRTLEEFGKYKRRLRQKEYDDEPIAANNDCMNDLEYLVGSCIGYHVPKVRAGKSRGVKALEHFNRMFGRDQRSGPSVTMGIGG